jgi:hypothetical protein
MELKRIRLDELIFFLTSIGSNCDAEFPAPQASKVTENRA